MPRPSSIRSLPVKDVNASPEVSHVNAATLRGRSRSEFVYEELCAAIREGRFGRGERIREEEVARALGVSRTPVREALQRLQERGMLQVAPGRGLVTVELSRQQTLELYVLRETLEGLAARFAAQHAAESEISLLHQLLDDFEAAGANAELLAGINRQLHQAIYDAAHNRYLLQMLNELHDFLALLGGTTFVLAERRRQANLEHRKLVAAIEERDPAQAEEAAREHIRRAQQARLNMAIDGSRGPR
jgi:DNA-binding GntR family transcriptional regulator